jgi:uncharacterized protein YcsI (UPF0317 family)
MTAPEHQTVRVEGLDRLIRTLKKAGRDISDLTEAHARAGRTVAAAAIGRVPRRTGKLAATIRPAKQARRARVMAGRAAVPYAGPIHWGWPARHISSQPFVSEAATATEPEWTADYRDEVVAALAKVKGA